MQILSPYSAVSKSVFLIICLLALAGTAVSQNADDFVMPVHKTSDFPITGDGTNPAWDTADWFDLTFVNGAPKEYRTRGKALWSDTGIYFLSSCRDTLLTNSGSLSDNGDLWTEDVIEVFLWPDFGERLYFEYEISPLNRELPILVPNDGSRFHGWLPWHYTGERKVRHAARVQGGPQEPDAKVTGWTAEFFFPFALFTGLGNCPPEEGTMWKGNMYRIDHDGNAKSQWAWCTATGGNFHDFRNFGEIRFVK